MGKTIYAIFLVVLLLLNVAIFITPVLAFGSDPHASAPLPSYSMASTLYHQVFVYFCHQKISRSLCLFQGPNGYFIGDCTPQQGAYVPDDSARVAALQNGIPGYKFPVCTRDVAIYLAMLLAGIAYPFRYSLDRKEMPDPIYLVAALVPMGLDGGLQLLSNLGIFLPGIGTYESTNLLRLLTGVIGGGAVTFYLLPILNRMFEQKQPLKTKPVK